MSTEQPHDPMTTLILAVGGVQADMKNALTGIDKVNASVENQGTRIGTVERTVAVHEVRLNDHDSKFNDAKPQKGRWSNWVSSAAAVAAIVILILDRLYLPAAH